MPSQTTNSSRYQAKNITRSAIRQAVASSTAIETGQPIKEIQRKLNDGSSYRSLIQLAESAASA
ncbi:MAG TPA: hypothetical protein VK110_06340 [Salinisphaeraceae bacterium]|nr:hypothetical protein [Salinisphaeraceae bacterium]